MIYQAGKQCIFNITESITLNNMKNQTISISNNLVINLPRFYIYYTGPASTPWSIGIWDRQLDASIKSIDLWTETNTGKQIREAYSKNNALLEVELKTLNN